METKFDMYAILSEVIEPRAVLKPFSNYGKIKTEDDIANFIEVRNKTYVKVKIRCDNKAKLKEYRNLGLGGLLIPPDKNGIIVPFSAITNRICCEIEDAIDDVTEFVDKSDGNRALADKLATKLDDMMVGILVKGDLDSELKTALAEANNTLAEFIKVVWGSKENLIKNVVENYWVGLGIDDDDDEDDDYDEYEDD